MRVLLIIVFRIEYLRVLKYIIYELIVIDSSRSNEFKYLRNLKLF